jgi:hypothetical protein
MVTDNRDHLAKPENHKIAIFEQLKHTELLV